MNEEERLKCQRAKPVRTLVLAQKTDFLRGILAALLAKLNKALDRSEFSRKLQEKRVGNFFSENRNTPEDEKIRDAENGFNFPPLNRVIQICHKDIDTIVDFGCGTGAVSEIARKFNLNYCGVDLVVPNIAQSTEITLVEKSILELQHIPYQNTRKLFILSNTACYIDDLSELVRVLTDLSAQGDKCFVIEPSASLFWENYFSGIQVFLRRKMKIVECFHREGWRLQCKSNRYFLSILGQGFFPVSYEVLLENPEEIGTRRV